MGRDWGEWENGKTSMATGGSGRTGGITAM